MAPGGGRIGAGVRPERRSHRRRPEGRCRAGGFTLVELLVVMSIFAIMAAVTAASYVSMSRRSSREGARETVMNVLRRARASAIDSGRGSIVRINCPERYLTGVASEVVAGWHFEEVDSGSGLTPGARNMHGTCYDADISDEPGALGLCMEFGGLDQYVKCHKYPIYDQVDGIRLEAYVRPEGTGTLGVMAKYDADTADPNDDEGYAVWLVYDAGDDDYSTHARFGTDDDTINLDSGDVTIPGYSWSHVAAEYDGLQARLYVNGVQVDYDPDPPSASRIDPARGVDLLIGRYDDGTTDHYFEGQIDEPLILSVAGGQRIYLPDRVVLVTGDDVVYFDPQGYLDLSHHTGPVYVTVGDPYQSAEVAEWTIGTGAGDVTLRPRNPFPPGGGLVLVGNETSGYELIRFESADTVGLTLTIADVAHRGLYGTPADTHDEGDMVYFARVASVGHTGIVSRVTE